MLGLRAIDAQLISRLKFVCVLLLRVIDASADREIEKSYDVSGNKDLLDFSI